MTEQGIVAILEIPVRAAAEVLDGFVAGLSTPEGAVGFSAALLLLFALGLRKQGARAGFAGALAPGGTPPVDGAPRDGALAKVVGHTATPVAQRVLNVATPGGGE